MAIPFHNGFVYGFLPPGVELRSSFTKDHIFLQKRNDDIEVSISNIRKIKKKLKWFPKVNFDKGIKNMKILDKKRLSKINLPSIKNQINLIKKFNINKK